jgi:glyoxylase-like metal-dependent hydrolase (beta-lactamase superfamily II)
MLPDYPFATPPAAGETFEVSPGIHWLRMPLPFALNHINLWLLEDDAGWTIVDTGFALDTVKACWQQILARLPSTPLGGKIARIIVTHFHPDHLGLAAWLQEQTGAPVCMTLGEYLTAHAVWHEVGGHGNQPMLQQFRAHGLDADRCAALERRSGAYNRGVPSLPTQLPAPVWRRPDSHRRTSLASAHRLRPLAGTRRALLRRARGVDFRRHAAAEDLDQCQRLCRYAAGRLARRLPAVDRRYRELPPETLVLPSHGLPFHGIENRVNALHAHHQERLQVLEEHCNTPRSAAELLITLFPRDLDTHQTMFAMGEAIAHLNRLEHAGRLLRLQDDQGRVRFVRKAAAAAAT